MKRLQAFRRDATSDGLWRGDERVPRTPKAFDLLRYLVEHADRLITQREILAALWTDTYVSQEVIKKYILGIRKVLGDRPDQPMFIRTVPKRGYQFIAPVADEPRAPTAPATAAASSVVERRGPRSRLESCFERARRGERQGACVTGDAGVGKTTFVALCLQRAAGWPDVRTARGQCLEGFGGQEAYYPVLEALGHLVHADDADRLVQTLARQAPTWLMQFPSLIKADQVEMLRRETLGSTRERMVREVSEALEVMTADRTLVLV